MFVTEKVSIKPLPIPLAIEIEIFNIRLRNLLEISLLQTGNPKWIFQGILILKFLLFEKDKRYCFQVTKKSKIYKAVD